MEPGTAAVSASTDSASRLSQARVVAPVPPLPVVVGVPVVVPPLDVELDPSVVLVGEPVLALPFPESSPLHATTTPRVAKAA
jgi:hypothetical protein